jgi:Fe-Mn family superoxide dismutase
MDHKLPDLTYERGALAPHLSAETLEYHHGKHHAAYVAKLNSLIPGTEYADLGLEAIIKKAPAGPIFNNAAQIWNHTFYWSCLKPQGGGDPSGALLEAINRTFGSIADFRTKFADSAVNNFGSGWTWLVENADGSLAIVNTSNAGCPLTAGQKPLLTCDVWEHAYYIDYRNLRPKYLEGFWALVNWDFVAANLAG